MTMANRDEDPNGGGRGSGSGGRRRLLGFAMVFAAFLIPAGLFLALGAGTGSTSAPPTMSAQTAEQELQTQGDLLYQQTCSTCHGATGQGTYQDGVHIPKIVGLGPAYYDFMMTTGRMPLADPRAQMIRKPTSLTPAQIHAITSYLVSLQPGGTQIPSIDTNAGNLSQGEQIFQLNCAPCHSATGNGGAVGPEVAPGLHQATPTQVGEAVRIGPGTMPVFGPGVIPDQELNSLVRYVEYLKNPDNAGGAGLGHTGPIIEGFVGLLVGLGLLVLVTRYIGDRA